jgi:lipopolysaccharide transport system permease protein
MVRTMEEKTAARPVEEEVGTEPALAHPPVETIRLEPTRGFGNVLSPRELWRYRDLAYQIAARDITVRYRQTALGAAWAVLQPVGFMVVFTLFFGNLAGVESNGLPYALFSLSGLVAWTFFATVVALAADSLVVNQALVAKIFFPRIFIPSGVLAAGLVDLSISLTILLVVATLWGHAPGLTILALPLLILIMLATALGIGAALSALNVRFRDVKYVVPFAIQMWLFLTPIVYPTSSLSHPWQTISAINPMVGVVEGFRWATLGSGDVPLDLIGISAASALVLLLAGLAYFARVERSFADLI